MKKFLWCFVAVALLCSLMVVRLGSGSLILLEKPANLLVNGGFEDGIQGWAFYRIGYEGYYRIATEDPQPSYRKVWSGQQSLELYTRYIWIYWWSGSGAGVKQTADVNSWNLKFSFSLYGAISQREIRFGSWPNVVARLVFNTTAGQYTLVYYYCYNLPEIDFSRPYWGHILLESPSIFQYVWQSYERNVRVDFENCFGPITSKVTLKSVQVQLELFQPVPPYTNPHVYWDDIVLALS